MDGWLPTDVQCTAGSAEFIPRSGVADFSPQWRGQPLTPSTRAASNCDYEYDEEQRLRVNPNRSCSRESFHHGVMKSPLRALRGEFRWLWFWCYVYFVAQILGWGVLLRSFCFVAPSNLFVAARKSRRLPLHGDPFHSKSNIGNPKFPFVVATIQARPY